MKLLSKIITDPPCEGCQKRKEWLVKQAAKVRALVKRHDPESNAARTVVRRGK